MDKLFRKLLIILVITLPLMIMLPAGLLHAQEMATEPKVEMADVMRSNGKIYVVVAVVVTILLGLFAYLIRLDKKISRLEKEL